MEYILYCDESSSKGKKFGDFFGGCIVSSKDLESVVDVLEAKKQELNLYGEIKWTKVTAPYLAKYEEIMNLFFSFVAQGKIRVRIMFRSMEDTPSIAHNADEKYFKLYYQFIKHAFGFQLIPKDQQTFVRIYLDQLPDKKDKCQTFKHMLYNMPSTYDFRDSGLAIRVDDIAEVKSHQHVLLQCTDIVLGAMYFRLNELHKEKPEGSRFRGKKTLAKEKLYKSIYSEISKILPQFNIGVSTGQRGYTHWSAPYQHWRFVPK